MDEKQRLEALKELEARAFEEFDDESRGEIADRLLELDPTNDLGRYIRWEMLDEEESLKQLDVLRDIHSSFSKRLEELPEGSDEREEVLGMELSLLSNLSWCEYFNEEYERALEHARRHVEIDDMGHVSGRAIYYSLLITLKRYAEAIEASDADVALAPIGEHTRAIALFETEGPGGEAAEAVLSAILTEPDLALMLIGIGEIPVDEDVEIATATEEEDDIVMQFAMLSELWGETEERLAFYSTLALAFAFISDRIDTAEDLAMLKECYEALDITERMNAAHDKTTKIRREEGESRAVEEAIYLLLDLLHEGAFS